MTIRPRRSGALVLLLALTAVLGAVIAAPALAADVTQTEPGGVQPEPSAPELPGRGPSPLAVATIVLMGAAMTAAAVLAVVSRRRRRDLIQDHPLPADPADVPE